jgi:hypothetical protein
MAVAAADMECADFHFVGTIDKSNNPHRTAAAVGRSCPSRGHVVAHSYGAIAAVLTNEGAAHLALEGTGHRPQDDPRSTEHMKAFRLQSVTQCFI